MIAVDTNVLIRYLVQDHPEQSAAANKIIEGDLLEERGYLSVIVLCETVWVLESAYRFKKEVIIDVLGKIFETSQLEIDDKDNVRLALEDYRAQKADYSDCLIGRRNRSAGCKTTYTFDRSLKGLPDFTLL